MVCARTISVQAVNLYMLLEGIAVMPVCILLGL